MSEQIKEKISSWCNSQNFAKKINAEDVKDIQKTYIPVYYASGDINISWTVLIGRLNGPAYQNAMATYENSMQIFQQALDRYNRSKQNPHASAVAYPSRPSSPSKSDFIDYSPASGKKHSTYIFKYLACSTNSTDSLKLDSILENKSLPLKDIPVEDINDGKVIMPDKKYVDDIFTDKAKALVNTLAQGEVVKQRGDGSKQLSCDVDDMTKNTEAKIIEITRAEIVVNDKKFPVYITSDGHSVIAGKYPKSSGKIISWIAIGIALTATALYFADKNGMIYLSFLH